MLFDTHRLFGNIRICHASTHLSFPTDTGSMAPELLSKTTSDNLALFSQEHFFNTFRNENIRFNRLSRLNFL